MYAVVQIKGFQYKVDKGMKLSIPRLDAKENSKIKFDKVLLIKDKDKIKLSDKDLKGSYVEAKILSHIRDKKIVVFKKKRRKGYQKKTGHRQNLSNIEITNIAFQADKKATQVLEKKIEKKINDKLETKGVAKNSKSQDNKDKKIIKNGS